MNFHDLKIVCESRLDANWTNTLIAYENVPFTPVEGTAYLNCFLRPVLSQNAALGGLAKRDIASFWIQVFVPLSIGSGLAYQYAGELETLFSNIQTQGLTFYRAETIRVGDEGNGWFLLNVRAQCFATTNC